jgi:hypothetical protein
MSQTKQSTLSNLAFKLFAKGDFNNLLFFLKVNNTGEWINQTNEGDDTLLYCVCESMKDEAIFTKLNVVHLLLSHPNIDPNCGHQGWWLTPLGLATGYGNSALVSKLLSHPRITVTKTPLNVAFRSQFVPIILMLLKHPTTTFCGSGLEKLSNFNMISDCSPKILAGKFGVTWKEAEEIKSSYESVKKRDAEKEAVVIGETADENNNEVKSLEEVEVEPTLSHTAEVKKEKGKKGEIKKEKGKKGEVKKEKGKKGENEERDELLSLHTIGDREIPITFTSLLNQAMEKKMIKTVIAIYLNNYHELNDEAGQLCDSPEYDYYEDRVIQWALDNKCWTILKRAVSTAFEHEDYFNLLRIFEWSLSHHSNHHNLKATILKEIVIRVKDGKDVEPILTEMLSLLIADGDDNLYPAVWRELKQSNEK